MLPPARVWPRVLRLALLGWLPAALALSDPPAVTVDLATVDPLAGGLLRVRGSAGAGSFGVPIAGGLDADGDGAVDYAMASMVADPDGRVNAGIVYLIFGDGQIVGELDTGQALPRILEIWGDLASETAGSEIWMDDVTGDGLGDLLIARQNYTPDPTRQGAGALTIVVGGAALRTHAAGLTPLDLRPPLPPGLLVTTILGPSAGDRLGIWMRTGDVSGDGFTDIVIGADQTDGPGESHRGAAYLIRGGAHLAASQTIDLLGADASTFGGHIRRMDPPAGSAEYHAGATCQIGDLDGNGTGEVLIAATLFRSGAGLQPPGGGSHSDGGSNDGTLFIAWDDNFTPWPASFSFALDTAPGTVTRIDGAVENRKFGEEILAGRDYDGDGDLDLFVGDLAGNGGGGVTSGLGHLFFDAGGLKAIGQVDLENPPPGLVMTKFIGASGGDIAADTAMDGDFDCDGIDDLAFSSPHANRMGRDSAGVLHVFFGQTAPWPGTVDLTPGALPAPAALRVSEIIGALGTDGSDAGDTLAYSGAAADLDGDCRSDLITNEMLGNGVLLDDVGNLIALSGARVSGHRLIPWAPPWLAAALAVILVALILRQARRRLTR